MLEFMQIFIAVVLMYCGAWVLGYYGSEWIAGGRERKKAEAARQRREAQTEFIRKHIDVIDETCFYRK